VQIFNKKNRNIGANQNPPKGRQKSSREESSEEIKTFEKESSNEA
jgi:hypothetical protein